MRWVLLLWLCAACEECTYDPNAPPGNAGLFEDSSDELADRVWNVGDHRVHERIVREHGFPDNTFERVYRVYDDGAWRPLGRVRDEENVGVPESTTPRVVGGRLFVFVGATTLTWEPGTEARQVSPYDAGDFQRCGLNGHYDVRVGSVELDGPRWTLHYTATREGARSSTESEGSAADLLLLHSEDDGVTWRAECESR